MSKPAEGAWHGHSPDHFRTRGAEVMRRTEGWFARCGSRVRGPMSSLDAAMKAADAMLEAANTGEKV